MRWSRRAGVVDEQRAGRRSHNAADCAPQPPHATVATAMTKNRLSIAAAHTVALVPCFTSG
jgi:hypothetical protein